MARRFARLLLVPIALSVSLILLYLIAISLPGDKALLFFPSNLQEIRQLADVLSAYQQDNPLHVLLLFCSAYLFKQTFAVPGSVFMNVLAGALFGVPQGFLLCCSLTAMGASLCYLLARGVGEDLANHYFPGKIRHLRKALDEHAHELPFFLLFLRLFPMSPNWALNMCSGVLRVPMHLFFISVFLGLMPYNYLCVTSGALLGQISDIGTILSWPNIAKMGSAALAALLPSILLRKCNKGKTIDRYSPNSEDGVHEKPNTEHEEIEENVNLENKDVQEETIS